MSAVEVYQHPNIPTPAPVSGTELDVYVRQADLLAQSNIIPAAYRGKPANILAAALTGRTFGWDALTAMRNGHVIEGTWTLKPEAMLALVRQAGHSVTGETSPAGAKVTGRRCDTGDQMTVEFAMSDAQRAGLNSKAVWRQYPQSMCWARAVSQLCRMLFPDVTLGVSYTPEELGANVDEDGSVVEVDEVTGLGPAPADPEEVAALRRRIVALPEERRGGLVERWLADGGLPTHGGRPATGLLDAESIRAADALVREFEADTDAEAGVDGLRADLPDPLGMSREELEAELADLGEAWPAAAMDSDLRDLLVAARSDAARGR